MTSPLAPPADATVLAMPGLEPDSLLALLALLGLLRGVETEHPEWRPRVSWQGPPWIARLHLAENADEATVARTASVGIEKLVTSLDVDDRRNVDFLRDDYRRYVMRVRGNPTTAALAAALTAEWPEKRAGGLQSAPLVMMFGQGHQNFLERLIAVPSGELPSRLRKLKSPPDMRDPDKIAEALFAPWTRTDDADAFRWDPQEDQRYALRYANPSGDGAALTVHGANRLAAIGFLSCSAVPGERRMSAIGAIRDEQSWTFTWPIWSHPLSQNGIEALLTHPGLSRGDLKALEILGVREIFRARRISNGKFMNVTRAQPVALG
jgi:hypothetical protein